MVAGLKKDGANDGEQDGQLSVTNESNFWTSSD